MTEFKTGVRSMLAALLILNLTQFTFTIWQQNFWVRFNSHLAQQIIADQRSVSETTRVLSEGEELIQAQHRVMMERLDTLETAMRRKR